ncbi:MAG: hypothetical protein AB8G23_03385 [Myxococcota bacterium]
MNQSGTSPASDTPAQSAKDELHQQIAEELAVPVRESVEWLAQEVAAQHGDAVLGVLFYGSCLRKKTDEGVLDFWVIVDEYSSAYKSWLPALVNPIAPPNVFYLEREYAVPTSDNEAEDAGPTTLRTKYGVISREAFAQGSSLRAWHPYIWARFAQPARLVVCRDEAARHFFRDAIANAVISFVGRLACQLPHRDGLFRFSLNAFWQEAFRHTYDSERRPEATDSILQLYHEDEARYDAVGACAFKILAAEGHFETATEHPGAFAVEIPNHAAQKRRWGWMRSYARGLGLVRLLKTAFTFGDWVPYVLWKLERHTGRKIELTERQRKHPLIFAWPVIIPLIRKRNLR